MLHLCRLHTKGLPFSRSYGDILPSSLTIVLPLIFGFSPCLPVSVCGTGTLVSIVAFLDSVDSTTSLLIFAPHHISGLLKKRICLSLLPTCLDVLFHQHDSLSFCVPTYFNDLRWYWNFHQLSIAYAFWPRLRSRLTLSGRAFLRNP